MGLSYSHLQSNEDRDEWERRAVILQENQNQKMSSDDGDLEKKSWYQTVEKAKYRYLLCRSFLVWVDDNHNLSCHKMGCFCHKIIIECRLLLRAVLVTHRDPSNIPEKVASLIDEALDIEADFCRCCKGDCLHKTNLSNQKTVHASLVSWASRCRSL